jgi:FkbM family methyltransferase
MLNDKIVIYDVGARAGISSNLLKLKTQNKIQVIGFEPDLEECNRIQSHFDKILAIGLSDVSENKMLYITQHPGCCSLKRPNIEWLEKNHPERLNYFKVMSQQEVPCMSLNDVRKKIDLPDPNIIKIDTQGSELDILKGATDTLNQDSLQVIELEVRIKPLYHGEGLFDDIQKFLDSLGFVLHHLKRAAWFREQFEFDAFFTRPINKENFKLIRMWDELRGLPEPQLPVFNTKLHRCMFTGEKLISDEDIQWYTDNRYNHKEFF